MRISLQLNAHQYPTCASLACDYLAIMASSIWAVNHNHMHMVVQYGLYRYLPVLLGIEAQYLMGVNLYGHILY